MNVGAILGLELLNELCDDVQQVLCGGVFIQRSKLVDGLFRAGLAAGQQVGMDRLRSVCRILALRSFWLSTKAV